VLVGEYKLSLLKFIYRYSWIILFAGLVAAGLFFLFTPKWRKYLSLQETRNTMVKQNNAKSEEIKEFKIKQERFTSEPAFVERTARETGMVTSDEVVYRFRDSKGKVPSSHQKQGE
jgi:cell division protein FtsB